MITSINHPNKRKDKEKLMRKSCDLGAWGPGLRTAGRTKLVFPSAGLCLHSLQEFRSSPLNGSCGFACFILAGRQPINVSRDSRGECIQKHPNSQVYIMSLSDAAFIISVASAPSSPRHFPLDGRSHRLHTAVPLSMSRMCIGSCLCLGAASA